MKNLTKWLGICLIPMLFWVSEAVAHGPMGPSGSDGWGPESRYTQHYDATSVEILAGEVLTVTPFAPGRGMAEGIHVQLKTDEGLIEVHLGPAWFLDQQETQIQPQDKIEVTGSKMSEEGETFMIAREVKKGDAVLELRDEEGFPVWSGWKRGR